MHGSIYADSESVARITIANDGRTIETSAAISILNTLMREVVSIQHVCGGKAQCGTCRVRIVEGAQFLSPMLEREKTRLAATDAPPDYRLACQTYVFGNVTIEIPAPLAPDSGSN